MIQTFLGHAFDSLTTGEGTVLVAEGLLEELMTETAVGAAEHDDSFIVFICSCLVFEGDEKRKVTLMTFLRYFLASVQSFRFYEKSTIANNYSRLRILKKTNYNTKRK